MVFDEGPFPMRRTKVFVLVGNSFLPNKMFTNKTAACKEISEIYPYVLEYIQCVRETGKMRLVQKHDRASTYKLWLTEDTDYHVIWSVSPELNKFFKYDEYDDVCSVHWDHPDIKMLRENLKKFPDWFVRNLTMHRCPLDWIEDELEA